MSMSTMGQNGEMQIPAGWAGMVDPKLSLDSERPLQNKAITAALQTIDHDIEQLMALRASFAETGLVKLTNASDVTESTGLALAASEKNPAVSGSLAQSIKHTGEKVQEIGHIYNSTPIPNTIVLNTMTKITQPVTLPAGAYLCFGKVSQTCDLGIYIGENLAYLITSSRFFGTVIYTAGGAEVYLAAQSNSSFEIYGDWNLNLLQVTRISGY